MAGPHLVIVAERSDVVQGLAAAARADGFQTHIETPETFGVPELLECGGAGADGLIVHLEGAGEGAWTLARDARRRRPRLPVLYVGGRQEDWSSKGVPWSLIFQGGTAPQRLLMALTRLLNDGEATPS